MPVDATQFNDVFSCSVSNAAPSSDDGYNAQLNANIKNATVLIADVGMRVRPGGEIYNVDIVSAGKVYAYAICL
jgi:hypothetical protein